MADSATTKALQKALDKALRDIRNYQERKPQATWPVQNNLGAVGSIERLIKNTKVGSPEREKYIDLYNTYKRKMKYWENKYKQYTSAAEGAQKAFQASVKLDPLIKKQQDNKDLGKTDPKLDAQVDKLTTTVNDGAAKAKAKITVPTVGTPAVIAKPTGPTGPAVVTGTATVTGPTKNVVTPTGGTGGTGPTAPPVAEPKDLTIDEILAKVTKEYGVIDSIFKTEKELQDLLRRSIGADKIPGTTDDLTVDQFVNELQNTSWFKKSAGELQKRGFYKRQYEELRKTLSAEDLKKLDSTSEYGRGLNNTRQIITDEAKRQGVTLDEADLDLMARDLYDLANEDKPALIRAALRAKITYKTGTPASGLAGENIAALRATAAANGLDLDKNFGNELQGWLQNIAQGESIETYKQRIRDVNTLTVPDSVKKLIGQGIDLATIFSPYKQMMASVLEINPEQIDLNDPTLRTAITGTDVLNMYDFQKQLKKDNRWQYTANAKQEVADSALKVLQDFGFQRQ